MHRNQQDRRVKRTQKMLTDACTTLVAKWGYENLTVKEVIDEAGVSRGTFYAHFDSKEALLAKSVERLRDDLRAKYSSDLPRDSRLRFGFVLEFFRHVAGHRCAASINSTSKGHELVESYVRKELAGVVRGSVAASKHQADGRVDREVEVQLITGAIWSLAQWWMHSRSPLTSEQLFQRFVDTFQRE